jgi:hypothetical protein
VNSRTKPLIQDRNAGFRALQDTRTLRIMRAVPRQCASCGSMTTAVFATRGRWPILYRRCFRCWDPNERRARSSRLVWRLDDRRVYLV